METTSLLPDPTCLALEYMSATTHRIVLVVRSTQHRGTCPLCGQATERVHSAYQRTIADLPISGNAVHLRLTVRKFFCDKTSCERRIFAERLPSVVASYARRTQRSAGLLHLIAYVLGGEEGSRVAKESALTVSADTLLRLLQRSVAPEQPTPTVLGVDDFAFRKGTTYGSVLVDLQRRCPIDLLPNRTAATLAAWLQEHPGIQIVTRDRSYEYAKGIEEGAPHAQQVTDRFHLLLNLREMLRRVVDRYRARLQGIDIAQADGESGRPRRPERSAADQAAGEAFYQKRLERHRQIQALAAEGLSKQAISRRLHLSLTTVYKYLRLEESGITVGANRSRSQIDPFVPYLCQRWQDGCHNASQLWREIRDRGYPGSDTMVLIWANQQRQTPSPHTPGRYRAQMAERANGAVAVRTSTSRQFSWFLLQDATSLDPGQQAVWERIRLACPQLIAVQEMAQQFQQMVRSRTASPLNDWLQAASASAEPELTRFADSLLRDKASTIAALSLEWSNGPTEGQVNRLKLIKRQSYGRAGFALLKSRVLPRSV